jgi:hypothetical protein
MCEFWTLSHIREQQIAKSAVRVMSIMNHQISKLIEYRTRYDSFSAKHRSTKPFFIRVQDVCDIFDIDIDLDRIQEIAYSQNPPWMMRRITCDRSLLQLESSKYDGYIPVFTDGS